MEYQTCSIRTAGPLSAAAQTVMAALKAQYAGRVERRPHNSFDRALRLSQNQGPFNSTQESYTQTKIFHELSERQLLKQSSVGEMELPSQPDLQQLHDRDNKFNPWGADKQGDGRPMIAGGDDDGNLSGFISRNNIPGPSRSPPEPDPQEEKLFSRNGFVKREALQIVKGLPETHSKISSRKEKIQASTEEYYKAKVIAHTPPAKRWKFGDLQIPILACANQLEEDDSGQSRKNLHKLPFWSFGERNPVSGEIKVQQNSYPEIAEKFKFNSVMFGGGVKDSGCKSAHTEMEEYPPESLEYRRYLKETPTSRNASQKVSLVPADSCHESATHKMLTYGSHLPVPRTLGSVRTSDFGQCTKGNVKRAVETAAAATEEHVRHRADLNTHQSNIKKDQMEAQERSIELELSAASEVAETRQDPKSFSEVGQRSSEDECVQNMTPPAKQSGKWKPPPSLQVSPTSITPSQERQPPANSIIGGDVKVPILHQARQPERDGDQDKTSETAKPTLALISDPRVCDASHLSQEEWTCLLKEAAAARALVATMVYQDGTTQLDPEQKCPPAVCGVLILLKKNLNSLFLEETRVAEERLLFLRHKQDLITSEMLMKMVCGTQILVCFKAKDLLRTALRQFSKDLSWKQVTRCQVLDPQIAAWLLDPADSASCFQDLFKKYCTQPITHTPVQAEPRTKRVTHVISSLSHLHRVMVELRNKLETRGLWQLYFCMEQKMIPVLAAMESHMIHVDRDALKKTSEMLGIKMKQLEQEAHQSAGQKFLVSSSSQLRQVLFEKLRLHERCENKKLPKTMLKQQQSTSEAVLIQLQDLHPLPKIILEYRQVHKIKSTFLDGILSCMMKTFISSTWNQTGTVSGRLSAKHPNFQALPRQPMQISKKQHAEGEDAELVTVHPRTMFIPPEGWTFLSADFCQVELRLLAHLSSDPELLRIFQNPEADFFNMLASQWKGTSEDRVTAEDREQAKRIVYSVIYGAGKERLSGILGVSAEEAGRFQDSFLQKYKKVQSFIQRTVQHCHQHGYVKSIMGRRRSLPHIHSTDWGIRNQAERQAVNFVVQGSAADLCKMAMIHICSLVASSPTLTARLVAQIHDELLFQVEDSQVEDFAGSSEGLRVYRTIVGLHV